MVGWDDEGLQVSFLSASPALTPKSWINARTVRLPAPCQPCRLGRLRRLPGDFEDRYGFRPYLVESFADEAGMTRTCLRAAILPNASSRTAGRWPAGPGSHAATRRHVKTVFVYVSWNGVLAQEAGG